MSIDIRARGKRDAARHTRVVAFAYASHCQYHFGWEDDFSEAPPLASPFRPCHHAAYRRPLLKRGATISTFLADIIEHIRASRDVEARSSSPAAIRDIILYFSLKH